jgi:hypothetical protein
MLNILRVELIARMLLSECCGWDVVVGMLVGMLWSNWCVTSTQVWDTRMTAATAHITAHTSEIRSLHWSYTAPNERVNHMLRILLSCDQARWLHLNPSLPAAPATPDRSLGCFRDLFCPSVDRSMGEPVCAPPRSCVDCLCGICWDPKKNLDPPIPCERCISQTGDGGTFCA